VDAVTGPFVDEHGHVRVDEHLSGGCVLGHQDDDSERNGSQ
jgi:hypothetical protein